MECAGYCNRGGREYNEDACKAWGNGKKLYAVVADGLGGHGGGSLASKAVIETVQQQLYVDREWKCSEQEMKELVSRANSKILDMQTKECKMKSTLVFLYADETTGQAKWMHIGDSRLYHFENGRLAFCTFDHSVPRMLAHRGEISIDEIRFHEDRNRVLRALGCHPCFDPEMGSCRLRNKVTHAFLLCTDGFWEYVPENIMEKTLQQSQSPEQWLKKMQKHLKNSVKSNHDNHSAVVVWS